MKVMLRYLFLIFLFNCPLYALAENRVYDIWVKTADKDWAGTDGTVMICTVDQNSKWQENGLCTHQDGFNFDPDGDSFERNALDYGVITLRKMVDEAPRLSVKLMPYNTGHHPEWALDWIRLVDRQTGDRFMLDCGGHHIKPNGIMICMGIKRESFQQMLRGLESVGHDPHAFMALPASEEELDNAALASIREAFRKFNEGVGQEVIAAAATQAALTYLRMNPAFAAVIAAGVGPAGYHLISDTAPVLAQSLYSYVYNWATRTVNNVESAYQYYLNPYSGNAIQIGISIPIGD